MHPLFVLVPLFSVICLNLPLRAVMRRAALSWVTVVCACQCILAALHIFGVVDLNSFNAYGLSLRTDRLGAVALLSAGLVCFSSLCAAYPLRKQGRLFNFANLLLIALAGANGVAVSRDIFSMYVYIEITAVASYILISFFREKLSLQATFKYIVLSSLASALMLAAIALFILTAGSTSFMAVRMALGGAHLGGVALAAVALFVCGLFIKGGQVPFHGWLPDVYTDSPPAVSVLLAGAITKLLGAFVLLRFALSVVRFSPGIYGVILFVGTLSIVVGAFLALGQTDLKRMFAYSSISQIGYILAGLGSGGTLGLAGAILHMFNHSVFKSTLFLNAAAVESRTSTRDINKLGGLAQKMPVTAFTSVIASLSCAGIPPLAGFWSKLLIIIGLWSAGFHAYAVIAVVASVVTLAYLLAVQRRVFWGKLKDEFATVKEAGWELLFPAVLLTLVTVGVGMAFPLMLKAVGL